MTSHIMLQFNRHVAERIIDESSFGVNEVLYRTKEGGELRSALEILPAELFAQMTIRTVADDEVAKYETRLQALMEAKEPVLVESSEEEEQPCSAPGIRAFNRWQAQRVLTGQYTLPMCTFYRTLDGGTLQDARRLLGTAFWKRTRINLVPPEEIPALEERLQRVIAHDEHQDPTTTPSPGARPNVQSPYVLLREATQEAL